MKTLMSKCVARFFVMVIIVVMGCFAVTAANDAYPESEHDYQNNLNQEWSYSYGEDAEGLFVTFSDKTSFEKPTLKYQAIISGPNGEVIGGGIMKETKKGDKLTITANDYVYSATGKEFAGKTLYIPGDSFTLNLVTDESVTDYGFAIDRISATAPDDVAVVNYYCCDTCGKKSIYCYNQGEEIKIVSGNYCDMDNSAFVSWVDDIGNEYYEGKSVDFASLNLRARRVPLMLDSEEVLSFSNSDPYFDPDYDGGYYLSKENYWTMQKNIYKVFGIGVLPAVGLSVALATYPDWAWNGSCYGMSTLAFLQHYGVIDVLEGRSESSISELSNTDDVVSIINYYQWSAAGSFLCENFSGHSGKKMYSRQLKDLYESVSEGNIVLFTYYSGEMFKTSGHTVLLTGAYTQKDGTKVLVAYDCNSPEEFADKTFETRFYIDKDFTSLKRAYDYPANYLIDVGDFNWTDDYKHFGAFDINNHGKVINWYTHYFSQLFKIIKTWFSLIKY